MALGPAGSHAYRRRQGSAFGAVLRWLAVLVAVAGTGAYAFVVGGDLARGDVGVLQDEVDRLVRDNDRLREEKASLQGVVRDAERRLAESQEKYRADMPAADMRRMLDLIRDRLDGGVAGERIAFLIGSAGSERACDLEPVTKRFVVRTPIYAGASDAVTFADNAVTVTATGESVRDAAGRPEEWFDPDRPVTVSFAMLGGETSTATGLVPVHHSVLRGGSEYRFTVTAGENRAFVNVTADRCDFP